MPMTAIEGFRAIERIRSGMQSLAAACTDDYPRVAQTLGYVDTDKDTRETVIRHLKLWKSQAEQLSTTCQQLIDMIQTETQPK